MNMNLSVSDGVNLNSTFLILCRNLDQVAKFFIETESHQWHVISIYVWKIAEIPGKSQVSRCTVYRIPPWPYLRLVKSLEDTYVRETE